MHLFYFCLSGKFKHLTLLSLLKSFLPVVRFKLQICVVRITSWPRGYHPKSHKTFKNKLLHFLFGYTVAFPEAERDVALQPLQPSPSLFDCLHLWKLVQWGDFVSIVFTSHFNSKSQHAPLAPALACCATHSHLVLVHIAEAVPD